MFLISAVMLMPFPCVASCLFQFEHGGLKSDCSGCREHSVSPTYGTEASSTSSGTVIRLHLTQCHWVNSVYFQEFRNKINLFSTRFMVKTVTLT